MPTRLLVNAVAVAAMLATYAVLQGRGVAFGWRVVAMGVVSAVLLGAASAIRRREG